MTDLPPEAPQGLAATPGDGEIGLAWAPNAEGDLLGYWVYRSDSENGTYVPLHATRLGSPSYTDEPVVNGVTYWYHVKAEDVGGGESEASANVSATPVDAAPSAPTGLSATPGDGQVTLDWSENGELDLAGYNVYRSVNPGRAPVRRAWGTTPRRSGPGTSYR